MRAWNCCSWSIFVKVRLSMCSSSAMASRRSSVSVFVSAFVIVYCSISVFGRSAFIGVFVMCPALHFWYHLSLYIRVALHCGHILFIL